MARTTIPIFVAITLGFYVIFSIATIPAGANVSIIGVLAVIISQFIFFSIAFELAELILSAVLRPRSHPISPNVEPCGGLVAVLYCCCDDADPIALRELRNFHGADVFILDDSKTTANQAVVDNTGFTVVRRGNRNGFKAGNLNHWFAKHGANYRFFLILDSDSIVTNDALWQLVRYAEHPCNHDVAIVQSSISARSGNRFQRLMSGVNLLRHRVLRRLHDRIGWTLSQGHNNLHRVEALRGIGGFDLSASCEDTVVSLRLLSKGWRIILVDVLTHDAEPTDVFAYRRRSMRWARQTADAILRIRGRVNIWPGVLLAQHLFAYLLPAAWFLALLFVLGGAGNPEPADLLEVGATMAAVPGLDAATEVILLAIVAVFVLRVWHWRQRGGTYAGFIQFTVVSAAVMAFAGLHTVAALCASFSGRPARFDPTGWSHRATYLLSHFWHAMLVPWSLCVIAVTSLMLSASPSNYVMALFFLFPIGCAPFLLWWFHRDNTKERLG